MPARDSGAIRPASRHPADATIPPHPFVTSSWRPPGSSSPDQSSPWPLRPSSSPATLAPRLRRRSPSRRRRRVPRRAGPGAAPAPEPPAAGPDGPRTRPPALRVEGPEGPLARHGLPGRHRRAREDRRAVSRALQGHHRLLNRQVPQQRRRHGHPGLPVPADQQARAEGTRGDDLGARRCARQLGHHHVPVRQGGGRARLRDHRPRLPRQHRLRRGAPPGHRLRRQGGRRRDLGPRVPEDAAARGPGPRRA